MEASSSTTPDELAPEKGDDHFDVVVVGGGPSGLVTAYELARAGCSVCVLEARERLGGRVLTHTMTGDQIAEAGAEYIDYDQQRVNHYIDHFQLTRMPPRSLYERALLQGHVHAFRSPDKELLPDELAAHMPSHLYSYDMEHHYFKPLWKSAAAQAKRNGVADEDAIWEALMGTSISDVLDATGASLGVRTYLRMRIVPDEGVELEEVPATQFADGGWPEEDEDDESFQLEGGNARLISAFAEALPGKIQLGAVVKQVHQHKEGVTLTYERGDETSEVSANYAVLAIPVGPLRGIEFIPSLPQERRDALSAVSYAPVLKVLMQFEGRPWSELGWNGFLTTDHPICVWHATEHQPGDKGILCFYATGSATHHLRTMDGDARDAFLLGILQSQGLLPEDCQPIATQSFDWPGEAFSGGGWCVYPLGQEEELQEILAAPEGRCYFAGEHIPDLTSHEEDLLNTIESALSSGMVAARAILKLEKKSESRWQRAVLTPAKEVPDSSSETTKESGKREASSDTPQEAELIVDALEDESFWKALGQTPPPRVKVDTPTPKAAAIEEVAAPQEESSATETKEPKPRVQESGPPAASVFEMIGESKEK